MHTLPRDPIDNNKLFAHMLSLSQTCCKEAVLDIICDCFKVYTKEAPESHDFVRSLEERLPMKGI